MTRRVSIRAAASADLANARTWYDSQRPGLGGAFLLAIADALTRIEENPEEFPTYYRDFRRVLVDRFPYKVFYRIHNKSVVVFRVLHAATDHRKHLAGA